MLVICYNCINGQVEFTYADNPDGFAEECPCDNCNGEEFIEVSCGECNASEEDRDYFPIDDDFTCGHCLKEHFDYINMTGIAPVFSLETHEMRMGIAHLKPSPIQYLKNNTASM